LRSSAVTSAPVLSRQGLDRGDPARSVSGGRPVALLVLDDAGKSPLQPADLGVHGLDLSRARVLLLQQVAVAGKAREAPEHVVDSRLISGPVWHLS